MQESSFDRFTLSSDYSLDTSRYKLENINHLNVFGHQGSNTSFVSRSASSINSTQHNHKSESTVNAHDQALVPEHYQGLSMDVSDTYIKKLTEEIRQLKDENLRLRETNSAWMKFRNQALRLGHNFTLDASLTLPNSNNVTLSADKASTSPGETQASETIKGLEARIDELLKSEDILKSRLLQSQELATNLKIKLEQTMTRCELSQVSYTRMKECYDDLLTKHRELSSYVEKFVENETSSHSMILSLKNELEHTQGQLKDAMKSLEDSKEELEFWVAECQKFKRDYLYYRMAADNNAKKAEQLATILKDKEADFKALEEEHVTVLKKIVNK